MGTIHHHVVIATTWNDKSFERAIEWLNRNEMPYTSFESGINGYRTIFVGPDGSKEGWAASDTADKARERFIEFIAHEKFWDWVEVGYGELGQRILRGSNEDRNS